MGGAWTAAVELASGAEAVSFFVQAVDAAGNVAVAHGKVSGYVAVELDTTPPTITATVSPEPNAEGWSRHAAPCSGSAAGTSG